MLVVTRGNCRIPPYRTASVPAPSSAACSIPRGVGFPQAAVRRTSPASPFEAACFNSSKSSNPSDRSRAWPESRIPAERFAARINAPHCKVSMYRSSCLAQGRKSSYTTATASSCDVTEHIRMDVETDIGHVVKMLASNKPDDLADLAL